MAVTKRIERFDEGMSVDPRSSSGCQRVQHFKVFPHKLVPQFSSKADQNTNLNIVKFAYAPWLSATTFRLFGLGVGVGTSFAAVYMKGPDIVADSWGTPANNVSAGGARNTDVFFYYKLFLYGWRASTALWRYGDLLSGLTFTDTYQSISYTNVAQPVHHPSDDCAYFFSDNRVHRLNNATWTTDVLILPDNLIITSGEPLGNYLSISCKQKSSVGPSVTYLWDRDSSLSTLSERIDWGEGDLVHIGNLGGVLIGVTNYFTDSALGHASGKIIVKRAGSERAEPIAAFDVDAATASPFTGNKVIVDGKLHFPMRMSRYGQTLEGIFAVDRDGRLTIPISEELVSTGRIQGILKTGEFWWLAHSGNGSVNRTDDATAYTYTSIYETNILGASDEQSQLVGATLAFEPLPSGATATLKYKKVGDTSWTTFGSQTTTGAKTLSVVKDSSNVAPTWNEFQFRLESVGGAVMTGLEWTTERKDKKPYGRG
jgi:hypothetical protein